MSVYVIEWGGEYSHTDNHSVISRLRKEKFSNPAYKNWSSQGTTFVTFALYYILSPNILKCEYNRITLCFLRIRKNNNVQEMKNS